MDKLDDLKKNLEIPEVVQMKADEALEQIKARSAHGRKRAPLKKKRMVFIAAAAAAVLSVSVAAAYMNWSKGMDGMINAGDSQKNTAVQTGLADFPEVYAEDGGVRITAEQSIVDNNYALISLRIDGVDIEKGEEPNFENVKLTVDGETVAYEAGFIGEFTGAAATEGFAEEDGSLEYMLLISADYEGQLIDKDIHIELDGFGLYKEKTTLISSIEGKWELDWTLRGSDIIYKAEINKAVGNSGLTLKSVEISPISIKAVFDYPKQTTYETVIDTETGEEITTEEYVQPAVFVGLGLKDGTIMTDILQGMGEEGYINDSEFVQKSAINTILDVDKIEKLLVWDLTGADKDAEEVFYINIR